MDEPRAPERAPLHRVRQRIRARPIAGLAALAAAAALLALVLSDARRAGPGDVSALDATLGRLNAGKPIGAQRERILPLVAGRPGFDQYRGNEPHQIAACRDAPDVGFSCDPS